MGTKERQARCRLYGQLQADDVVAKHQVYGLDHGRWPAHGQHVNQVEVFKAGRTGQYLHSLCFEPFQVIQDLGAFARQAHSRIPEYQTGGPVPTDP